MSQTCTIEVLTDNRRVKDKLYVVVFSITDTVQLLGGEKVEIYTNEKKTIILKGEHSHIHFYKPGLMGLISARTRITSGYGFRVSVSGAFEFLFVDNKITAHSSSNQTLPSVAVSVGYKFGDMFLNPAAKKAGGSTSEAAAIAAEPINEVSLEGQDLTFAHAWRSLGSEHAISIFKSIGGVFDIINDDVKKSKECLMFLAGAKGGGPHRTCFAGQREDGSYDLHYKDIDSEKLKLEENFQAFGTEEGISLDDLLACPGFEMFGQLRAQDPNECDPTLKVSWSGFFKKFFSVEGLASFYHDTIESIECSDDAMVQLLNREFVTLIKAFFIIGEPVSVLCDRASNFSRKSGIARLINFRIKLDLDKFEKNMYPNIKKVFNWLDEASFEILREYEVGDKRANLNRHRACAFGWRRKDRTLFFDAIKAGRDLLWHSRDEKSLDYNMIYTTEEYNNVESLIEKNRVNFSVGDVFYIRCHFCIHLTDLGALSLTTSGTSLYFKVEIKTDRRIEVNLVDMTGAQAKVAQALMSNVVTKIMDSVKAVVELTILPVAEETNAKDVYLDFTPEHSENIAAIRSYNRLNFFVTGTIPKMSILGKLFSKLWEETVMSNFLFEFSTIWSRFWNSLSIDIAEVSRLSLGKKDSLQNELIVNIRNHLHIEGENDKIVSVMKSLQFHHSKNRVHGQITTNNIFFDHSSHKWQVDSTVQFTPIDTNFKSLHITLFSPPEAIIMSRSQNSEDSVCVPSKAIDSLVAQTSFDMWSIGALLFQLCHPTHQPLMLTCKKCPGLCTDKSHSHILLEMVPAVKIAKILSEWTDEHTKSRTCDISSGTARNLISLLLMKDPSKRISIERALQHPFVTSSSFFRLPGDEPTYDIFLSYRVDCDSLYAEMLYEELTALGYKVWWDKKCIPSGKKWQECFCQGLISSATFVPLLSKGAINYENPVNPNDSRKNFSKLLADSPCDNVLLEWRLALEMVSRGMIGSILPVLIGESQADGSISNYFASSSHPVNLPEIAVNDVEDQLHKYLVSSGLGYPYELRVPVKQIVDGIVKYQGFIFAGPSLETIVKSATENIVGMIQRSAVKR